MAGETDIIAGIDIRSLQYPVSRGVFSYGRSVIEAMMAKEGPGAFRFFSGGRYPLPDFLRGVSPSNNIHFRWPSKILNGGMRFFGSPTIDVMLGTKNVFIPNLDYWSVGPKARLTVTVHDLSFFVDPTWFTAHERVWQRLIGLKGLLRRADAIITLSEHTKNEIVELLGIDGNKIRHIAPGVPALSSRAREVDPCRARDLQAEPETLRSLVATNAPRDDDFDFPYILFLGAIEPRKNIKGALAAFDLLAQKNKDIHFILAGPRSTSYKPQTTTSSDRIHFIGQVTHEQKGSLLRNAKALFMPSFYEGFGFPTVEAMSAGVPVVASSAGALPETVGNAGLLLDPMDTGGFADALDQVISDDDLRQTLIARGHERVKDFSWERCAEETLALISNV